jgi:hypothetical protein
MVALKKQGFQEQLLSPMREFLAGPSWVDFATDWCARHARPTLTLYLFGYTLTITRMTTLKPLYWLGGSKKALAALQVQSKTSLGMPCIWRNWGKSMPMPNPYEGLDPQGS